MAGPIPRVNFEVMQRYHGQTVSLIGQVKVQANGSYILQTSDQADVTITPNVAMASNLGETAFVEVIGIVTGPREVKEESHINLRGQPLDMKIYNEMVKLANGKYMSKFVG